MKHWYKIYFILLLLILSCKKKPDYPNTPVIEKKAIEVNFNKNPAELKFVVSFKDGDGDLGFKKNSDTCKPYHKYNLHLKNGRKVPHNYFSDQCNNNIDIKSEFVKLGDHDSLPAYREGKYKLIKRERYLRNPTYPNKKDTIRSSINMDHYNFLVDVLIKQEDGSFEKFKFFNPAFTLNGRFPYLNPDGRSQPLDGNIEYKSESAGLSIALKGETVKFRIRIKDRALHTSNAVESREFVIK